MVVQSEFQNIDRAIFISSNCHWYCLIINAAAHHHIFTKILFLEKDDVLPYYHSDVRNFLSVQFPTRWKLQRRSTKCSLVSPLKTFAVGYSEEHCSTWDKKLKLLRTPIHCQQYKNYATLLHITVSNALKLVVAILNTWDIKRSITTMD